MRRTEGQASVEWIALIAVVALVLGAAAALTYGGLGAKVAWAYRRGLCAVTAQPCPPPPADRADLPPCPLSRSSSSQDFEVRVAFIELGGGLGVQEETTSDGQSTVTFTNSGAGGGVTGAGASFQIGTLKAGAEADIGASVKFTQGKAWTFPSRTAADAFIKRYGANQDLVRHVLNDVRGLCFFCGLLGIGSAPVPPPADQTYLEVGTHLTAGAEASAVWGAELGGETANVIGERDDRRTGRRTAYVRLSGGAVADAFAAAGVGVTATRTGLVQITADRRGRLVGLQLQSVTAHAVLRQVPSQQPAGGQAPPQVTKNLHGGGGVHELESDLDLTDPANAAAAHRFLRDGDTGALIRWIDGHGSTTLRTFASQDTRAGGGATLALAAEMGGGYAHTSQNLQLTRVLTRLPGLGFLPRTDCLVQ